LNKSKLNPGFKVILYRQNAHFFKTNLNGDSRVDIQLADRSLNLNNKFSVLTKSIERFSQSDDDQFIFVSTGTFFIIDPEVLFDKFHKGSYLFYQSLGTMEKTAQSDLEKISYESHGLNLDKAIDHFMSRYTPSNLIDNYSEFKFPRIYKVKTKILGYRITRFFKRIHELIHWGF
jgi:hypothetical protein